MSSRIFVPWNLRESISTSDVFPTPIGPSIARWRSRTSPSDGIDIGRGILMRRAESGCRPRRSARGRGRRRRGARASCPEIRYDAVARSASRKAFSCAPVSPEQAMSVMPEGESLSADPSPASSRSRRSGCTRSIRRSGSGRDRTRFRPPTAPVAATAGVSPTAASFQRGRGELEPARRRRARRPARAAIPPARPRSRPSPERPRVITGYEAREAKRTWSPELIDGADLVALVRQDLRGVVGERERDGDLLSLGRNRRPRATRRGGRSGSAAASSRTRTTASGGSAMRSR